MDSENQQCYQAASSESQIVGANTEQSANSSPNGQQNNGLSGSHLTVSSPVSVPIDCTDPDAIASYLRAGHLLVVNSRRRNGLVIYKEFHAEFAGPGAAVGGLFDCDCQQVIPVGDLSLIQTESHEERQRAYLIRRQWIRLTQQFTDKSVPLQRAQLILNQFETYFDAEMIARLPDEAFAMLVGVLPQTVRMARRPPGKLKVRV